MLSPVVAVPYVVLAQQPAAAPVSGATVHGMVVDADDALIPGAAVTLTSASGKSPQTATSKSDGTYSFRGVAPGTYSVSATAPGFNTFVKQGVVVTVGANLSQDVKMAVADTVQTVNVTADTVQLSVDPENNASSTVISGDALNALSDDPDELATELAALAGPSTGPNGGQIYIDGFTGGQLPPKSSILAIRINSNPFSAQYDALGYGRIEILTKPGTDKFHGSGSFQFSDKIFNTSSPFLGATNNQPDYHTIFGMGSLTGPIRPGTSFTLSASRRQIASNSIINPLAIYSNPAVNPLAMCYPGDTTCSSNPYPTANRAAPAPQTRWEVEPRIDTLIGQKNTLTTRFGYEAGGSSSSGGGNSLPSLGDSSSSAETTVQISDTQLISSRIINETRFEYQRDTDNSTPVNAGPGVSVQGFVSAFGSGSGSTSNSTESHIEVQNYTSIQLLKNFVRLGGRLRTSGQTNNSNGGAAGALGGSLSYSYLLDPCTDASITNKPSGCLSSDTTPCATPGVNISSYQCGIPFQFNQTTILNPTISARETDVGIYAEDDWKVLPNLTWSLGVRLEAQNYINSTHDIAPRTSIAYGIPRKNGKTTTVLRGGFGIFYDRYELGSIEGITQGNPANQTSVLYQYPGSGCTLTSTGISAACKTGGGTSAGKTVVPVTGTGLRAPYTIESAATLEQQVGKYASVTLTYLNARGEHQFLNRTFPSTSGFCPNVASSSGLINCTESEGIFRQDQINANINIRTNKGITIFGYYSANWANSNLSGITNPFSSSADYGRAGFAVRSRLNIGGTIALPFLITASPLIFAQSGNPYNITTGVDNNADGVIDDRPMFAPGITAANASCTNANDFVSPTPATTFTPNGYTQIPINFCTGPANVSINLRLSRTFGFGPKTDAAANTRGQNGQNGQGGPGGGGLGAGPNGGGGGGGGRGGGGGFGGGGGGGRGGGGGGGGRLGSNTGRKYNLTLGAQAFNLFNEIPYASPGSTLNASFGKTTKLAGGQFATANAVRRITLQASFSF
jgi:hypothetical protein